MKVLQICPSYGLSCGIATFAGNMAEHLTGEGIEVETQATFHDTPADLVVIQHEFGLFKGVDLDSLVASYSKPVILFVHTGGVVCNAAAGFVAMSPGMLSTNKPIHLMNHPGYYAEPCERAQLRASLGQQDFAGVICSNGFISSARKFMPIISHLLPVARKHNWLINLLCSRHATHTKHDTSLAEERALAWAADVSPHLRLDTSYKPFAEMNQHFQAADLLWCWTDAPSKPYASGTCSDQWTSGTRVIVAAKHQHFALWGRENVAWTPPDFQSFIDTCIHEIESGPKPRHDGKALSWQHNIKPLAKYLRGFN